MERNIELINHENTITERHLSGSRLHLNKRGTAILSKNFTEAISNSVYWHSFLHSLNDENYSVRNVNNNESRAKNSEKNNSLSFIRKGNFNKLVLGHININSIRNKFHILVQQITNNVEILMIYETKLDSSFVESQILIPDYTSPYRLDRNYHGGGIMLYVREDIPSKLLLTDNQPIEGFYIEINLRKKKWLLCGSYNPNRNNIGNHLDSLSRN